MPLTDHMQTALQHRQSENRLRKLNNKQELAEARDLIDFSSNDYLSFASLEPLRLQLVEAVSQMNSVYGPASSRLLDGNTLAHLQLEADLAEAFNGQDALLFNSGFDANVAIFSTLPAEHDVVLFDEYIHASVHDGMRAGRCPARQRLSFRHNRLHDFERQLRGLFQQDSKLGSALRDGLSDVFVAVEALYSMDGDHVRFFVFSAVSTAKLRSRQAPLREMIEVAERLATRGNVHFIVDEVRRKLVQLNELILEDRLIAPVSTARKARAIPVLWVSNLVYLCACIPLVKPWLRTAVG